MDPGRVIWVTGECDVFLVVLPGDKPSSGSLNMRKRIAVRGNMLSVWRREYRCVTWLTGVALCCWSLFVGRT